MELYISAYNEKIFALCESIIRTAGRRAQKSLWGRRFKDIGLRPESLLFLDSGGVRWDIVTAQRLMGTGLREYAVFKNDGRIIHILSENGTPGASSALEDRIGELDRLYRCAEFTVIDADPMRRMPEYRESVRRAKQAVIRGAYNERSYSSLLRADWTDDADVIITDEYTMSAVLMAVTGEDEPVLVHTASENNEIYVPFSSLRPSCFIPGKKASREAAYGIYMWLLKMGVTGFANRVKKATDSAESLEEILTEIQKPARERKSDNNENKNGKGLSARAHL